MKYDHLWPNDLPGEKVPFFNYGYDTAGASLSKVLGAENLKPRVFDWETYGEIHKFYQQEFTEQKVNGLSKWGYYYLPYVCEQKSCKLHVVMHGCYASAEDVGQTFLQKAGFLEWAAANDLIILYPQSTTVDKEDCWDFYAKTSKDYYNNKGE